ncbi:MAG: LuxR C-terminal-related transcriptional regulator [Sedimenticola sp.]
MLNVKSTNVPYHSLNPALESYLLTLYRRLNNFKSKEGSYKIYESLKQCGVDSMFLSCRHERLETQTLMYGSTKLKHFYETRKGYLKDPVRDHAFESDEPVLCDDACSAAGERGTSYRRSARAAGLSDWMAHSIKRHDHNSCGVFVMIGVESGKLDATLKVTLHEIIQTLADRVALAPWLCVKKLGFEVTDGERQVLSLVRQGKSNTEIAKIRCKSVATIKNRVTKLMDKLGTKNRTELAKRAADLDFIANNGALARHTLH